MNKIGLNCVSCPKMKMRNERRPLAKGQVWKTRAADIEILGLGKRYIHYKVTKQLGLKSVSAQVSWIEAMEEYLRRNEARLVRDAVN